MPCKQAVNVYVKPANKNKAGAVEHMTQICHLLHNQKLLLWSKSICESTEAQDKLMSLYN